MINKHLSAIFLLIFCNASYACIIELNSYLLINNASSENMIKTSDCSETINNEITNKLHNVEGAVPSYNLSQNSDIVVTPRLIQVDKLESLIKNQLKLEESQRIQIKTKLKNIASTSKIDWTLSCKSCLSKLGTQSIKLQSDNKTIWISGVLEKKITGYKASSSIPSMTKDLSLAMFAKETLYTSKPENYLTNLSSIIFYRTNKKIRKNNYLKKKDLTAKNLVSPNQKVQVQIQGRTLNLKTFGRAKKRGKLGDYITIQNLVSKKTYIGKVIDFNKVVVEL